MAENIPWITLTGWFVVIPLLMWMIPMFIVCVMIFVRGEHKEKR